MKNKKKTKKDDKQGTKLIGLIIFLCLILYLFGIFENSNIANKDSDEIDKISFVLGTDVSRYQGDINFDTLYDQSIRFAFIKSTEGTSYIDPNFSVNFFRAKESGMKVGAYHFYRFEDKGLDQASHFIENVKLEEDDLPPVIDLEYYGDYIQNPKDPDIVISEVSNMVEAFRNHYNKRPIIYCNRYVYEHYNIADFDVDIWFRSIDGGYPNLPNFKQWTFWQFDDKATLEGYGGPGANEHIDLNYFYGDMEELEDYGRNNS